nr:MAG TPA: hypothetical protein [Caudoviricetes sp.]
MAITALITAIAALITAITGLAALLLGIKQLQHDRQYDGAHQTSIEFQRAGQPIQRSTDPEPYDVIRVAIRHRGFETLHGVRTSLVWENGAHWDLHPETHLHPGETLGPKHLEIPCSDLDKVHLHVVWQTPHPAIQRNGIRYQALRMNLAQEAQQWQWHPFENLRRHLHRPVGKWKPLHHQPSDEKTFPGWPNGMPAKTIDW